MIGMRQDYIDMVKSRVKVGDVVRWRDQYDSFHGINDEKHIEEGTVLKIHPRFCITDKGTIAWSLIAGYLYQIENKGKR